MWRTGVAVVVSDDGGVGEVGCAGDDGVEGDAANVIRPDYTCSTGYSGPCLSPNKFRFHCCLHFTCCAPVRWCCCCCCCCCCVVVGVVVVGVVVCVCFVRL